MKPIQDKAEVSIDFPEKFYVGSFARDSKFEARTEADGLLIKLEKPGDEKRAVEIHLHHHLLADILSGWADSLGGGADCRQGPPQDTAGRAEEASEGGLGPIGTLAGRTSRGCRPTKKSANPHALTTFFERYTCPNLPTGWYGGIYCSQKEINKKI